MRRRLIPAAAVGLALAATLLASAPANAAATRHDHHKRTQTIDVTISDPLFTTIFVHNPHNYKDGYSAIRVTFKVTTNAPGTPSDFGFQVVLLKWSAYTPKTKPKVYIACGRHLRRSCVSVWLRHDLPPVGKSKTWIIDARCTTGRYFVRTTLTPLRSPGRP